MKRPPAVPSGSPHRWWQVTARVPVERVPWATDVVWRHGPAAASEAAAGPGAVVLEAGFPTSDAARRAATELTAGGADVVVEEVVDEPWLDEWRRYARAVEVADRVVVVPAWLAAPSHERHLPEVRIDPGRVFGHGGHPTTVLAIEAMVPHLTPAVTVLDVGCGSGVVAITALVLGAGSAIAVDIDPAAIDATRANAELNHVAERLSALVGEIDQLVDTSDVTVANIGARTLVELAPAVAARTRPGGTVVLGGFLADQAPAVASAYRGVGCALVHEQEASGWAGLVLTR